ncbi:MAG: carboxylesterase family protein [Deltaproteobacteria bacterium]|nr:carboxylesterase family protein [Deltaproteobacteria bacterium]
MHKTFSIHLHQYRWARVLTILFLVSVLIIGCGGDDDDNNKDSGTVIDTGVGADSATLTDSGGGTDSAVGTDSGIVMDGGGGSDGGAVTDKGVGSLFGFFGESRVEGLTYETPTAKGTTDADGKFTYNSNETVSFSIGGFMLGSTVGKEDITTLDLVANAADVSDQKVTNLLVLIQSLDEDGNLNTRIKINEATANIVEKYADDIDLAASSADFAADESVVAMLAELNTAAVFNDTDPRDRTLRKALAAQEFFTRATAERKTVNTGYGDLKGYSNGDTWQFLGIPYAKPPLGNLRWKPPQKPDAWEDVRDAVAWSDQSAQNPVYENFGEGGMSEDCLYLNVTAPKDASNVPVMVWFHGGGFDILTGNTKAFNNAASLPTKGVVLVVVNHRLGPFGYLAHPLLTQESGYGGSGNYGQLDLIMALTWVKNNISNFGGDPSNVTIFGESGGGGKVISLMASPLATSLFHKAVCQSGTGPTVSTTLADQEAAGEADFAAWGVTTLEEARAKTWVEVMSGAGTGMEAMSHRPNVDSHYMLKDLSTVIQEGLPNDVPFLVGVNSGDMEGMLSGLQEQMALRGTYSKAKQYVYKFSRVPEGWAAKGLLSYHGAELIYVFNYPQSAVSHFLLGLAVDPATEEPLVIGDLDGDGVTGTDGDREDVFASAGFGDADKAVVDTVMTIWTNFAKTGEPSTTDFSWPAYTSENDTYVEIDATLEVRTNLSEGW